MSILLLCFSETVEIHLIVFAVPLFFVLADRKVFLSKNVFDSVLLLVFLLGIAMLSSLLNSSVAFYDWIRDFLYFAKPIMALISGFYLACKINDLRFLGRSILLVATLSAMDHLIRLFFLVDLFDFSISTIRNAAGISSMFEVIGLILLITSFKFNHLNLVKSKALRNSLLILIGVSFVFYFSRTMFVSFVIFLLAIFGYIRLTRKGVKYFTIVLILMGAFYAYLFSIDLERDEPGIESFLYKLKIAPAEIFIPSNKIDVKNHESLWDHWRAYEALKTFEELNKSPASYIYGKGLGSLVDLKFEAPLGGENIRYIPIIHNGYVYITLKTGIVGMLIYLLLLVVLYLNTYKHSKSIEEAMASNVIAGIALYYLFTSLIITGVYNVADIFTFVLGILFFVQFYINRKHAK